MATWPRHKISWQPTQEPQFQEFYHSVILPLILGLESILLYFVLFDMALNMGWGWACFGKYCSFLGCIPLLFRFSGIQSRTEYQVYFVIMSRFYPPAYSPYRQPAYSSPKQFGLLEKYPEDIQCVYPSDNPNKGAIYVSNVQAASNIKTLNKFRIRAVMTCAKGYDRDIPKSKIDMFEYFPFDDKDSCMISPYFNAASDFIANALAKTNILVHCIAGVSRSVSMVLAYLIRDKAMTYEQAYKEVKSRRNIIHPNDGFIKQLKQYAAQLREKAQKSMLNTAQKSQKSQETSSKTQEMSPSPKPIANEIKYTTAKKQQPGNSDCILNGEEHLINRSKNDNWMKSEINISIPEANKPKHEEHLTKSLILIDTDGCKTPQRKVYKVETQIQRKEYSSVSRPRSAYFDEMNKELNDKIKAIHEKYEKERQALLSRRVKDTKPYSNSNIFQFDRNPIDLSAGYTKPRQERVPYDRGLHDRTGYGAYDRGSYDRSTYDRGYDRYGLGIGRYPTSYLDQKYNPNLSYQMGRVTTSSSLYRPRNYL